MNKQLTTWRRLRRLYKLGEKRAFILVNEITYIYLHLKHIDLSVFEKLYLNNKRIVGFIL